jgi:hypothetical protein
MHRHWMLPLLLRPLTSAGCKRHTWHVLGFGSVIRFLKVMEQRAARRAKLHVVVRQHHHLFSLLADLLGLLAMSHLALDALKLVVLIGHSVALENSPKYFFAPTACCSVKNTILVTKIFLNETDHVAPHHWWKHHKKKTAGR